MPRAVLLLLLLAVPACAEELGVLGAITVWPRDEAAAGVCQAQGIEAGNAGRTGEAKSRFLCAVVRWPIGTVGALNFANYGVSLMRSSNYPAAVESFLLSRVLNPVVRDCPPPYACENVYGWVGQLLGTNEKMETRFDYWTGNAFLFAPTTLSETGVALGQSGREQESIIYLWAGIMRYPKNANEFVNLGVSLSHTNNDLPHFVAMGAAAMAQALDDDPTNVDSKNVNLMHFLKQHCTDAEFAKARKHLNPAALSFPLLRVVPRAPKDSMEALAFLNYMDALMLSRVGKHKEAQQYLKVATKAHSTVLTSMDLASAYAATGDVLEARYEVQRAQALEWHEFLETMADELTQKAFVKPKGFHALDKWRYSSEAQELLPYLDRFGEPGREQDVVSAGAAWKAMRDEYVARHRAAFNGQLSSQSKVVVAVVNPAIGIGNRVLSLLSAFLLALLTDRIMLIYWPTHVGPDIHDLFTLPPGLEWDYLKVTETLDLRRLTHRSESLEFFASSNRQHALDDLVCQDLKTKYTKKFLHFQSNQNLINFFAENPHYSAKLRSVFGNDIAGPLARWLLRPSRYIAIETSRLLHKSALASRRLIGIHMRMGMGGASARFDRGEDFFHAQIDYPELLGRVSVYFGLLPTLTLVRNAFFVAADSVSARDQTVEHLRYEFPSSSILHSSVVPERNTDDGVIQGQIDLWALAASKYSSSADPHQIIRVGKNGYSAFAVLAQMLASSESRVILETPCPDAPPCFTEKDTASRTGTAGSMLEVHPVSCGGGVAHLIRHLTELGTLLPWCGEFEGAPKPRDIGYFQD